MERNLPHQASLSELVEALELCDRLERGHVPGFQPESETRDQLVARVMPALAAAALVAIEGLAGSDDPADALAMLALIQRVDRREPGAGVLGHARLRWALERLERDGSPFMQGASGAVSVLLGFIDPDTFGERMGSWLNIADANSVMLARRLAGALVMATPLLEVAPGIIQRLIERIDVLDDASFLRRLPALRDGFDVLSPAARQRFLQALRPNLADTFDLRLDHPAAVLARWAEADAHGRHSVEALALPLGEAFT
jgi:hypothetical protein